MSISLDKGGKVSLSKSSPGLSQVRIGLGWDVRGAGGGSEPSEELNVEEDTSFISFEMEDEQQAAPQETASGGGASGEAPFDLDAVVFLLNEQGRVRQDTDFVFYNNLQSPCGSVRHTGDNRTGEGEGDDEAVYADLNRVPQDVTRLRVAASIHKAEERNQHFGLVESAFIRIVNEADGTEVARYNLTEQAAGETTMIFGELYREGSDWSFQAVGEGVSGGLMQLCRNCGVNVG